MPDGSTFQAPIHFRPVRDHVAAATASVGRELDERARAALSPEQRAAVASQPDLRATFDDLLAKAIADGPGSPGNRTNPFWITDLDGSDLAAWKLFEHAEYTVSLDRTRARLAAKAAA